MKNYFLSFFRSLPTDGEHQVPLTFTTEVANSWVRLSIPTAISPEIEIRTKSDNTWQPYTGGTNVPLKNVNDWVQFRNKQNTLSIEKDHAKFEMGPTGARIKCSGDIQSMLNYSSECPDYCFSNLFQNQTALTSAPYLPAEKIGKYSYGNMFNGCTSLTTAPELPATTLAEGCYLQMFRYCTSLTTAPELPATTLAENCYYWMFADCTSLTTAPELPATTLFNGCYEGMFVYAENISNVEVNFTSWVDDNGESCTTSWMGGVNNTGTFTCPAELPIERGINRIPEGWEVSNDFDGGNDDTGNEDEAYYEVTGCSIEDANGKYYLVDKYDNVIYDDYDIYYPKYLNKNGYELKSKQVDEIKNIYFDTTLYTISKDNVIYAFTEADWGESIYDEEKDYEIRIATPLGKAYDVNSDIDDDMNDINSWDNDDMSISITQLKDISEN